MCVCVCARLCLRVCVFVRVCVLRVYISIWMPVFVCSCGQCTYDCLNPKRQTLNSKPETRNPKPQTPNRFRVLEEEFEKELMLGKVHGMAFGFGETRQVRERKRARKRGGGEKRARLAR